MANGLTTYQQRRLDLVNELIEVCISNGITSKTLAPVILYIERRAFPNSSWANRVNQAGLTSQLYRLLFEIGEKKLRANLAQLGSPLDAIVRGMDMSPEDIEKDVGRRNVDPALGVPRDDFSAGRRT